MVGCINKIFNKNNEILNSTVKTIYYFRVQNFNRALYYATKSIELILLIYEDIINNKDYFNKVYIIVDNIILNDMLREILQAQELQDYILLADFFELKLNPFILQLQEIVISDKSICIDSCKLDKNLENIKRINPKLGDMLTKIDHKQLLKSKEYEVEFTSSGLLTIALYDNGKKYYLHSNGIVHQEALILAREWFHDDKSSYNIYGIGLGYHIIELMELDDSITIDIYESDLNMILFLCAFTDSEALFSSDRVNIHYDPSLSKFFKAKESINDETSCFVHYPSIRNVKDIYAKEELEDFFIYYNSINNQLHYLNNNFKINIKRQDEYVDNLESIFSGKDLYIIAAGPSLDKNFLELKHLQNDSIILATGTVVKKLLKADIQPDYFIIIDGTEAVFEQIKGLEDLKIPLLYLSTTYYKVPREYSGKKYFILQEGFTKANLYAKKNGFRLYKSGGSVSTVALDIGISFKCKRIIFLGLDLAYTNMYNHAIDTTSIIKTEINELRQIEDIYGDSVGTTKNLDIYRKWIENRIKGVKDIEIIDATEGGAKIKGMKIMKLSECINNQNYY